MDICVHEAHSAAVQEQNRRLRKIFCECQRSLTMDEGIQYSANKEDYRNQTKMQLPIIFKI